MSTVDFDRTAAARIPANDPRAKTWLKRLKWDSPSVLVVAQRWTDRPRLNLDLAEDVGELDRTCWRVRRTDLESHEEKIPSFLFKVLPGEQIPSAREVREAWVMLRNACVIQPLAHDPLLVARTSGAVDSAAEVRDAERPEWFLDADRLLARLESSVASFEDRITGVLFAETTAFSAAQKVRLLPALLEFIQAHRFNQLAEIAAAAGSAVRKFAMNMPPESFEQYATLFRPTETATLPCELELELAKAAGWRLAQLPQVLAGAYPTLESELTKLANDYLSTRLVLQKNYASIALHAVLAVVLLHGRGQESVITRIESLGMPWFSDLLARRLRDLCNKRQREGLDDNANLLCVSERLRAACPAETR